MIIIHHEVRFTSDLVAWIQLVENVEDLNITGLQNKFIRGKTSCKLMLIMSKMVFLS